MALKRALFESAKFLGYNYDCFCRGPDTFVQKPYPITKYDALRTSVQKKSEHSEQLGHASLTRPLFFNRPTKKISGLACETTYRGKSFHLKIA